MARSRLVKRILLVFAILLGGIVLAGILIISLARSAPAWYRDAQAHPAQVDAANRADQKLSNVIDWASRVQARMMRQKLGTLSSNDSPIGPITVLLTGDELDSFAASWQGAVDSPLRQKFSRYFTDPRLSIQNSRIVLAAQSTDFGIIAGASFTPGIDSIGRLDLHLNGFTVGRLPAPRSSLQAQIDRLENSLHSRLPGEQNAARLDETFTVNAQAAEAVYMNLIANALSDQTSPAVIMVPFNLQHPQRALPVKVTAIKVKGDAIEMTLDGMTEKEESDTISTLRDR